MKPTRNIVKVNKGLWMPKSKVWFLHNDDSGKRMIKESDYEKSRRIRAGYKIIKEIDPNEFISKWESNQGKQQEQDFAWNEGRLKSALEREYDDAYPRITRSGDVEDGRHRIAAAKSKGQKIDVAVNVDD